MKTTLHTTWKNVSKSAALILTVMTCLVSSVSNAQTWGTQSSMITDAVNGICFIKGTNTGYAACSGGRILKTSNGGLTWNLQNSGTVLNLYGINFSSVDTGYAVGDSGHVLRTTTGGSSWVALNSGTSERLNAVKTKGGKGYIVGNAGTVLMADKDSLSALTSGTSSNLYGVFMQDASTAFIAGGGLISGTLIATYNSGNVWVPLNTGAVSQLNDVYFVNDSTGYVCGNNGAMYRTLTSGSSWTQQTSGTLANLRGLSFVSADSGYAVGANGSIVRTVNGSTWTTLSSGVTATLNAVSFTDGYTGYAGGNTGTIIKTCPTVRFEIGPNDSICENNIASFTNRSMNSTSYTWIRGLDDTSSTSVNYSHMYDSAGTFSITLVADNGTCTTSQTQAIFVDSRPDVDLGGDTSICSTCTIMLDAGNIGSTYVWYRDGVATGVVSRTNTVGISGRYKVVVTNASGCTGSDSVMVNIATGISEAGPLQNLSLYPNPNSKQFDLQFNVARTADLRVEIVNYLGQPAYTESVPHFSGTYKHHFSMNDLAGGVYFVNIISGETSRTIRMIIQ